MNKILVTKDPGHGFEGEDYYLLADIKLDSEVVKKLIDDLNDAAREGATWPVYCAGEES